MIPTAAYADAIPTRFDIFQESMQQLGCNGQSTAIATANAIHRRIVNPSRAWVDDRCQDDPDTGGSSTHFTEPRGLINGRIRLGDTLQTTLPGFFGCSRYRRAGCIGRNEPSYSPGTDDTTEWPMPAYNRGFSASNPDAVAPREGVTERWSTELPSLGSSARPVVTVGRVLVPTAGALVVLVLDTGAEHWRHGQEQPWSRAPIVHNGTANVGFADQRGLVALDVESGDEQWRVETRVPSRPHPRSIRATTPYTSAMIRARFTALTPRTAM